MKKKLVITTLAIFLLAAGSFAANAQYGRGWNGEGCERANETGFECEQNEWRGKNRQDRNGLASDLIGLTEDQQQQIAAIREEVRSENEDLREKMRGYCEEIMALTAGGTFDEKAIRVIAAEKAEIQVEIAVSKARMHSRILAVMTPEQQEIAQKLRACRQDGRGEARRGSCGGRV